MTVESVKDKINCHLNIVEKDMQITKHTILQCTFNPICPSFNFRERDFQSLIKSMNLSIAFLDK